MKAILLPLFCFICLSATAQKGRISGKIVNEKFEAVKKVKLTVTQNGSQVAVAYTDSLGTYTTKDLDTGTCTVRSSYPFYRNVIAVKVPVKADKTTPLEFQIQPHKKGEKDFIETYFYFHPFLPSRKGPVPVFTEKTDKKYQKPASIVDTTTKWMYHK